MRDYHIPGPGLLVLEPALTRSCCRLRASLSTDIAGALDAFWPPNFNVIFDGSGDFAGILSFTLGCGGSATNRLASFRRL